LAGYDVTSGRKNYRENDWHPKPVYKPSVLFEHLQVPSGYRHLPIITQFFALLPKCLRQSKDICAKRQSHPNEAASDSCRDLKH
jgi:hypothetical protein